MSPEAAAKAAAEVDAEVAAYRLAEIRRRLDRTQTDVADAMGVDQRRVSRIELSDVDRTQVSTLAAYAAALGGRLRIEVEVDGELIPLR